MEAHLLRFVERVRCLSLLDSSEDHLISSEFSLIRQKSASLKDDCGLTTRAGEMKENMMKNRYKDILPYDQTRVCLTPTTSESESDYINANFIQGAVKNKLYIATQGPLSSTVVDFWRMIWQQKVKVIIMACREVELGKKKCEVYWASTTEASHFGPFSISTFEESRPNAEVIIRTLGVKYCDKTRQVFHFQYTAWPDHGIPNTPDGILGMLELARQKQANQTDPIVIHCSAGCGRTGVICAVDCVNDLLLYKEIKEDFNVLDLVLKLRRQRPSAVQTKEQYGFIFHAVAQMFQKVLEIKNTKPTSSSLYMNANSLKTSLKHGSLNSGDWPVCMRNPPLKSSHSLPQASMNGMYAAVNKPKLHPPTSAHNPVKGHYYDNDKLEKSNNAALYSTVKPKNRSTSFQPPSTSSAPDRFRDSTTNQRAGVSPKVLKKDNYEVLSGGFGSLNKDSQPHSPLASANEDDDDDYENLSSVIKDTSSPFGPGSLGFKNRIKKPKGPRDPPAEWSRAER
ncbi:hypothetical protein DNTS_009504 [Danionella cerebrum]|uniref:protein-tyrosine-phosphatase n=1 Tax=Danionella cerebrum TaxID=2873325 RepID=A0A553P584_9TELE|nr:hypothetical protein DNTS_009504 [Danionella translucida]